MVVAYDGSGFHGFAANAGVPTVATTLAAAIETVLGHAVTLTAAGRTDRGVHALGQVVTFDVAAEELDLFRLQRSLNRMVGPTVAVRDITIVGPDFDARFSARSRRYRYHVLNRPEPDPFLAATAWHVERPLNRAALDLGCDPFIGEHDFAAFCRKPTRADDTEASLVRRVLSASWHDAGEGLLHFDIEATAFCHQMVRSIVGTMVEVGLGRRSAGELVAVIRSGDRRFAGDVAPPLGLVLWSVHYDGWAS